MKIKRMDPKVGIWKKNKIMSHYFLLDNFNLDSLSEFVLNNFKENITYSVLLRLKYDGGLFGMGGNQIGFKLLPENKNEGIGLLFDDLINLIRAFMSMYKVNDLELIQLLYITVSSYLKLRISNLSNIKLNKEFVNVKNTKKDFNFMFIPLTIDYNYYGEALDNKSRLIYIICHILYPYIIRNCHNSFLNNGSSHSNFT